MIIPAPVLDLLLASLLCLVPLHPHSPKALALQAAGGEVKVFYQTVDYNAERLAPLKPGFSWHMAFASMESAVPLHCGEHLLPAGHYKLNMQRGETEADWQLEIMPYEYWVLARQLPRIRQQGGERLAQAEERLATMQKAMQEKGQEERVVLGPDDFVAEHAKHLQLSILLQGYDSKRLGKTEALAGVAFSLRMSFGDFHKSLSFREAFSGK